MDFKRNHFDSPWPAWGTQYANLIQKFAIEGKRLTAGLVRSLRKLPQYIGKIPQQRLSEVSSLCAAGTQVAHLAHAYDKCLTRRALWDKTLACAILVRRARVRGRRRGTR